MRPSLTADEAGCALLEPPVDDRCPYHRPFPAGFAACPAYTPVAFRPTDMQSRPLGTVFTCANLEPARDGTGSFYARCRVGSRSARERRTLKEG